MYTSAESAFQFELVDSKSAPVMNRAFSAAGYFISQILATPQAADERAPLALNAAFLSKASVTSVSPVTP